MSRKDEVLRLMELADRKGFDVTRSTIRDHWRLIDRHGKTVRNGHTNSAAFKVREATRLLEEQPDRKP
jgi:hypothetical protein